MRSSTTSTTRTMFLCLEASIIRREALFRTSWTNSPKVLVLPLPKPSVEILWSCSVFLMSSSLLPSVVPEASSAAATLAPTKLVTPSALALASDHHSNLVVLSACFSMTSKLPFSLSSLSVSIWCLPVPTCAASSRRPTNSRRRSAMPALAPDSLTSGVKSTFSTFSSSCFRADCTNGCRAAFCALRRSSSFRWRSLLSRSPHSLELLGGITIFLCLTSSSPLKGKRPVTRPYMTTPMAQTSILRP
mmetsp:Transcript_147938/g.412053  ORF Transcript_147938/g.412053 Transcript_147938/m.412053 type:complete len:246 (+) Transcript_147938:1180-1917(+)